MTKHLAPHEDTDPWADRPPGVDDDRHEPTPHLAPGSRKVAEAVKCPKGCDTRLRWSGTWTATCPTCGWNGSVKP